MLKKFIVIIFLLFSANLISQTYRLENSKNYGILDLEIIEGLEYGLGADIYVNDEYIGKVEDKEIKIEGLLKRSYYLKIAGDKICNYEKEYKIKNDFEVKENELILNEAQRDIYINSNPQGVKIFIDGKYSEKTTPSTITVGMDLVNITLDEDFYNIYSINLNIPKKGETIYVDATLEKNNPPSKIKIIKPNNNEKVNYKTKLLWEKSNDNENSKINYEIWLGINKNILKLITITNETFLNIVLDKGQKYYWKIIVVDNRNNKTESNISSFITMSNVEPEIIKVEGPESIICYQKQIFKWEAYDDDEISYYEIRNDYNEWKRTEKKEYVWENISNDFHVFEVRAIDNDNKKSEIIDWRFNYDNNCIPKNGEKVKVTDNDYINDFRIIGLPGDKIELKVAEEFSSYKSVLRLLPVDEEARYQLYINDEILKETEDIRYSKVGIFADKNFYEGLAYSYLHHDSMYYQFFVAYQSVINYSFYFDKYLANLDLSEYIIQNPVTKEIQIIVPEGFYFYMGDNTTQSFDSRFFGFLPKISWEWNEDGIAAKIDCFFK